MAREFFLFHFFQPCLNYVPKRTVTNGTQLALQTTANEKTASYRNSYIFFSRFVSVFCTGGAMGERSDLLQLSGLRSEAFCTAGLRQTEQMPGVRR